MIFLDHVIVIISKPLELPTAVKTTLLILILINHDPESNPDPHPDPNPYPINCPNSTVMYLASIPCFITP